MKNTLLALLIVCAATMGSYGPEHAYAQEPVAGLSDLVGAKAGQAENTVKDRGYTWVKTDKQAAGIYSYWTESGSGKCVTIRTADGRYQSIVYASKLDCKSEAQDKHQKHAVGVQQSWTDACEKAIHDKVLRQHGHVEKVTFLSDTETHTQKPNAKYVLDGKGKVLKESGNWKKFTFHCVYDTEANFVDKAQYEIKN
jgi:hypothetical protein